MHAGLALGEESLRASGSALLVVALPCTAESGRRHRAREFAVVVGQLCDRLGIPTRRSGGGDPGAYLTA